MSHMRVRRQTIGVGQDIEDREVEAGWLAGTRTSRSADRLGLAIDSTVVTGNAFEETTKIEVVAGRIIRDGHCGRRFACVTLRRSLTSMLVAAALKSSGWHAGTEGDVVNDGAKGMRSLVTDVAPHVATPMLDWFHLAMKLHPVKTSLFASTFEPAPAILQRCRRLWAKIRDALWRGRVALGIELARTLEASLAEAAPLMKPFYASTAMTAEGATLRLREFLENNASILVDYAKARQQGRRISTAASHLDRAGGICDESRRQPTHVETPADAVVSQGRASIAADPRQLARRLLAGTLQTALPTLSLSGVLDRRVTRRTPPPTLFHSQHR